jgi:hypothetical protein
MPKKFIFPVVAGLVLLGVDRPLLRSALQVLLPV